MKTLSSRPENKFLCFYTYIIISDLPQLFIFIAFQLKSLFYSCSCAGTGYLEKTASCSCARTRYCKKKLAVAVRAHVRENK